MIKKNLKIFVYSIIRRIYKLFDRRKVWMFTSWNGELYADNPKYLFEYVQKVNDKSLNCIWITDNKDLYKILKEKKIKTWFIGRWKRHLASSILDKFFFSDSVAPLYGKTLPSTKFINLWHGMPIKQIGKNKLEYDYFTVTNPNSANIISEAFGLKKEQILIIGQAKNDGLYTEKKIHETIGVPHDAKIITYMPTYRGSFYCSATARNNQSGIFIDNNIKNSSMYTLLIEALEKYNAYFIIKPHIRNRADINVHSRIIVLDEFSEQVPEFDNYEILGNTDILISDFSSLILDFYATKKPILFYAPDWEEYCNEQKLYFDYKWLANNNIIDNFEDLTTSIIDCLKNKNNKYNDYDQLKAHFNTYSEYGYSARIYEYFKKI